MALDVQLLRSSFELVAEREPELTSRFYEILFERYPQTRSLFPADTSAQARMLQEALVAVVDHLDDAPWLGSTLATLGRQHAEYGVTSEMFGWVGECLLATLAEAAGPYWAADLERAWAEAYGAIVGLMQVDVYEGVPSS